jgi:hypothetical protein
MTQAVWTGPLRLTGVAMMIDDARAPEKTLLDLSPLVLSQPTSRGAATRL